jgi:hypothetical protein
MQIRKKGDEIKKKSSPLKLQSQSQPNFAEMILGWSSSKIVSGISEHRKFGSGGHLDRRAEPPDTFLEENHPMTISSKFVLIEQMVSDKKIFMGISHRVLY